MVENRRDLDWIKLHGGGGVRALVHGSKVLQGRWESSLETRDEAYDMIPKAGGGSGVVFCGGHCVWVSMRLSIPRLEK